MIQYWEVRPDTIATSGNLKLSNKSNYGGGGGGGTVEEEVITAGYCSSFLEVLKIVQVFCIFTWKLKDLSFLPQKEWSRWGTPWQQVVQNCHTCLETPSVKFGKAISIL